MAYYGTQGGGIAEMQEGSLVWREPPDWFTEAKPGDEVPDEWGIAGPFDDETNMAFNPDDYKLLP